MQEAVTIRGQGICENPAPRQAGTRTPPPPASCTCCCKPRPGRQGTAGRKGCRLKPRTAVSAPGPGPPRRLRNSHQAHLPACPSPAGPALTPCPHIPVQLGRWPALSCGFEPVLAQPRQALPCASQRRLPSERLPLAPASSYLQPLSSLTTVRRSPCPSSAVLTRRRPPGATETKQASAALTNLSKAGSSTISDSFL